MDNLSRQAPTRVIYLARQRFPAEAPQALQIVSTCRALAEAGIPVTIWWDRPLDGSDPDPSRVLEEYGLTSHPLLDMSSLRLRGGTGAGLEYRLRVAGACLDAARRGQRPVFFTRHPAYAATLLRTRAYLPRFFRLVFEWHYLASANALEKHDMKEAQRHRRHEEILWDRADAGVAISHCLRDYLTETLASRTEAAARLTVISNGGPEPGPRHTDWLKASPSTEIVYAGLFRRVADFTLLFQCLAMLPLSHHLSVYGADEEGARFRAVQQLAHSLGVSSRVHFKGHLSPAALRTVLSRARVAVATFADSVNMRHCASPLKILEYQAAGVPLVSTDHPTVRDLVEEERTGLLVPHDDPAALAHAIQRLTASDTMSRKLSLLEQEVARNRTWNQRGRRLVTLLNSLP